jgi:hypothetical protein
MYNEEDIILCLRDFDKPDLEIIKDNECLICLESLNQESKENQENKEIIKIPCGCANSTYHIECITKLILSGENKNFCPHCKTKYEILSKEMKIKKKQFIAMYKDFENKSHLWIMVYHIIMSSIIDITSGIVLLNEKKLEILSWIYFTKLIINFSIGLYSKYNPPQVYKLIRYSEYFQCILFIVLVCNYDKILKYNFLILIVANIFFSFVDIILRKLFLNNRITE